MRNLSERNRKISSGLSGQTLCLRVGILLAGCVTLSNPGWAAAISHSSCRMQATTFEGWQAEELSNDWVRLIIVPRLGGRLMQVEFGEHRYLFVNPKYRGKYFPPGDSSQKREWINYGGDKLWPLPEGHGEGYWPGPVSDVLDDGEYKLSTASRDNTCMVRLEGPSDSATGLQYSREIRIGDASPQISFHAIMKNDSEHVIRWSMQSVTQYDTADSLDPANYNRDFWAFALVNPKSAYSDGYRVRNGLADDPSYAVQDGMFTLHWLYLENEVWLDSEAGWIAVVDDSTRYGMIERFQYFSGDEYPGKASIIFYKNGATLELDDKGMPALHSNNPEETPYYMEAEINSPMKNLEPGSSYTFDTSWFPVRAGKELRAVTAAGVVERSLTASHSADGVQLAGSFGVFFAGKLYAHLLDSNSKERAVVELQSVDPFRAVELNKTISVPPGSTRVSLHLNDDQGVDHGSLGEVEIAKSGKEI